MSWKLRASIFTLQSLFAPTLFVLLAIAAPLMLTGPYAFAAGKPARIVILGTDDQLYVCSGDCAKTECLTCPVKGLQVRARSGILPVEMRTQFDMPGIPGMPPSDGAPVGRACR